MSAVNQAYAIVTRYVGPTARKGSRIIVTCDNMRKVYDYDHGAHDPHTYAANKFCKENKFEGAWVQGRINGSTVVFVRTQTPMGFAYATSIAMLHNEDNDV